jgi:hypothetical protein
MFRRLTLRVFVPALTGAAIVAPGAAAMPARDTATHATRMHNAMRSPAFVDAAAHAVTVRAIGAKLVARASA